MEEEKVNHRKGRGEKEWDYNRGFNQRRERESRGIVSLASVDKWV